MGKSTTYLQMCQNVRRECSIPGSGPASVEDQTGILEKIVYWVAAAWKEIQNAREDWLFKWDEFSFNTQADKQDYLAEVSDLKRWGTSADDHPITAYLQSDGVTGEYELSQLGWDDFKAYYLRSDWDTGMPASYAIAPDNTLYLGPCPNDVYVIQGEYFKENQALSANADIIQLDDDYVDVILWRAVRKHAAHMESAALFDVAENEHGALFAELTRKYLPAIDFGKPLA